MLRRLAGFLFLSAALVHAANIERTVSDAVGGELLGRVQVVDKNWVFTRWKTTFYGEVLNLTNHYNVFATGLQSGSPQPFMAKERALPVVPTAGLVFEF
jgi:hypothetical protein